jgi:DNA-binding LytR/AlgR family response regulator
MSVPVHPNLRGRCLLVVEDEFMIALDLAQWLEELGMQVIGPAGSVSDALKLVEANAGRIDGALLDINLRGERVYPVADALAVRGLPFAFTSGYDDMVIAPPYANAQRYEKPVDRGRVVEWLAATFNSDAHAGSAE